MGYGLLTVGSSRCQGFRDRVPPALEHPELGTKPARSSWPQLRAPRTAALSTELASGRSPGPGRGHGDICLNLFETLDGSGMVSGLLCQASPVWLCCVAKQTYKTPAKKRLVLNEFSARLLNSFAFTRGKIKNNPDHSRFALSPNINPPLSHTHTFFILRQPARYLPEDKLVQSFPDHCARACLEAEESTCAPPEIWGLAQSKAQQTEN